MKKKIIIIVCSIAVVIAAITTTILLINKPDQNIPPTILPKGEVKLSQPRGLALNGTIFSWDAVENASEYIVYVGNQVFTIKENSIDLNGKANERDKLSVVAVGYDTYCDSVKSIEKVYITRVDQVQVDAMNNEVIKYMATIIGESTEVVAGTYKEAINKVTTALYKEGLVDNDIKNIVTTIDEVTNSLNNFTPDKNTKASDYVELITNQVSKVIDLNIPSYATVVAIKEIAVLATKSLTVQSSSIMKLANTNYIFEEKLIQYLETLSNRDLEKIAFVLDSLKEMYAALEVELPQLLEKVDTIYENVNNEYITVYSLISNIENIVAIKDYIFDAVLVGMPTIDEYTEVMNLFINMYEAVAPEYIANENIFEECMGTFQYMYSGMHKVISFIAEMDAEMVAMIMTHVNNIEDIIKVEIIDVLQSSENKLQFVYTILAEAGLSEEEADKVLFGILELVEDITENPEELLQNVMDSFDNAFTDKLTTLDFSIIENDPLVGKIIQIALSEDPLLTLNEFLVNDIEIEKYISYKENKTLDDVVLALYNVDINEIITFFQTNTNYTEQDILNLLGLNDIVNLNIKGLLQKLISLLNMKTLALFNDVMKIDEIADIEGILLQYFKCDIKLEESCLQFITNFLDKYNLNIDYAELVNGLIKALGVDQIYNNLESIYNIIKLKIDTFDNNYVPLIPTLENPSFETLGNYGLKYLTYGLFGENSEIAIEDLTQIYNQIIDLGNNNDILNIINEVVSLVNGFDKEFNFKEYLINFEYRTDYNDSVQTLIGNLIDKVNDTYNWILTFEPDLTTIATQIEEFVKEYFYQDLDLSTYVVELFNILKVYDIIPEIKQTIDSMINDSEVIANEIINLGNNNEIINIYNNLYDLISTFDYTFDEVKYKEDPLYKEKIKNNYLELIYAVYDQAYNLQELGLSYEINIISIGNLLDEFTTDYFGVSFEIASYLENLYIEFKENKITEATLENLKNDLKLAFDEKFEQILMCILESKDSIVTLLNELSTNIQKNYESLTEEMVLLFNNLDLFITNNQIDIITLVNLIQDIEFIGYITAENLDNLKNIVSIVKTICTLSDENINILSNNVSEILDMVDVVSANTVYELYQQLHNFLDYLLALTEEDIYEMTTPPVMEEVIIA